MIPLYTPTQSYFHLIQLATHILVTAYDANHAVGAKPLTHGSWE